jgi:hypothetical protein
MASAVEPILITYQTVIYWESHQIGGLPIPVGWTHVFAGVISCSSGPRAACPELAEGSRSPRIGSSGDLPTDGAGDSDVALEDIAPFVFSRDFSL